jgi:hypothetical protein
MATGPDLRIGDADREAAAAGLREHYAQGRLTLEEFNQRLDATFAATTQSQLHRIVRDLPHATTSSAPLPSAAISPYRERARREYRHGEHHHGTGARPRRRALSTLIAVAATWLIMAMLVIPDLRFPLPGKLGIMIAVFAMIRGLVRRIIGGRGRF